MVLKLAALILHEQRFLLLLRGRLGLLDLYVGLIFKRPGRYCRRDCLLELDLFSLLAQGGGARGFDRLGLDWEQVRG